jgi:hypothetical protein
MTPETIEAKYAAARAEVARQTGISEDQVVLASSEPVDWPDACLGMNQPNVQCAAVITPGYRLVFMTPSGAVEAHIDESGQQVRISAKATTPAPTGLSGIEGQVLIGPACPGLQRVDTPCPDKPYQATLTVLNSGGQVVATVQSDANGYYNVALEPGTYTLRPESPGAMPSAAEQSVTVVARQFTQVKVSYDSGIR